MAEQNYQPPCKACGARCCQYVALEISKPTCKRDYDNIRWYLLHKNIGVYVDHDKQWYVEFRSPCEALTDQNQCGIYAKRPRICRMYGSEEGECEYYDTPYSLYFSSAQQFEQYLANKRIDWQYKI